MRSLEPLSMPLLGRHLIEASAGTGKTYTISSLILRLLLGHRNGATGDAQVYSIEQLLIVTFTNAATEELLGRIRERVQQAADVFAGGSCDDSYLNSLVADSQDTDQDLALLLAAMHSLDRCSVFTIHGFAQRILKQFAFESQASFTAELDENSHHMLRETVMDFWRGRVYPLTALAADRVLETFASALQLQQALDPLLKHHELRLDNEPRLDWQALLETVERQGRVLLTFWQQHQQSLRASLNDVGLKADPRRRLSEAFRQLDQGEIRWSELRFLLGLPDLPAKDYMKNSPPVPKDWPLLNGLAAIVESGEQLSARLLVDGYRYCLAELPRHKVLLDRIGFDDLLTQLDSALQADDGDLLAATIRRQYPVALIDEFQDTDRLQWRIFSRIYDQPNCGLLLIGDPKQAIYAFRGADVSAYIQARRQTASRFALDTNYRSTAALIEAVNALFHRRDDRDPFLMGEDIQYQPVRACDRPDQRPLTVHQEIMTGLRCFAPPEMLSKGDFLDGMADACAAAITELLNAAADGQAILNGRPLCGGDIAVLVRNRFEAASVQRSLLASGVPSVYQGRDSVFLSPAALDVYQLLLALMQPGNERRLRAAMATSILQLRASELQALFKADNADLPVLQERFEGYADTLRRAGPLPSFRRMLHDYQVPGRLLALSNGARLLTDVLHIIELLQVASRELDGEEALLACFSRWLDEPDGELAAQQLRLESDAERVQIVTLHKSKGLQYPLVYLPYAAAARSTKIALYHDPQSMQAIFDLRASDKALASAERERLAEDVRLLYVGLTRAEQLCVIGLADVGSRGKGPSDIVASGVGHLLHLREGDSLESALGDASLGLLLDLPYWPRAVKYRPAAQEKRPELSARRFSGRIGLRWQVNSYSALMRQTQETDREHFRQPELGPSDNQPQGDSFQSILAFSRGARPGSFLHGLLERVDFSAERSSAATRRLIETSLQREGYSEQWGSVLLTMLDDVLGCDLDGEGLRLETIGESQRRVEMGFDLATGRVEAEKLNTLLDAHRYLPEGGPALSFRAWQGLLTGFIDLVIEVNDRYYVLDYKSNHLGDRVEDYAQARLAMAMAEHRYDLQYLLYLVALQRMLRQRLGSAYSYQRHIGGAWYLFLRGVRRAHGRAFGVFHDRPSAELIDSLDDLLGAPA